MVQRTVSDILFGTAVAREKAPSIQVEVVFSGVDDLMCDVYVPISM